MARTRSGLKDRRAAFFPAILFIALSGCAFNFGGHTFGGSSDTAPSASSTPSGGDMTGLPKTTASSAGSPFKSEAHLGNTRPLGLEPLGNDQSPRSQLMSEGTLGYFLDHLFGGNNPQISSALLPPPTYGTTTAGGVPGGLWPGNWWIQGQGGGYNLVHLP